MKRIDTRMLRVLWVTRRIPPDVEYYVFSYLVKSIEWSYRYYTRSLFLLPSQLRLLINGLVHVIRLVMPLENHYSLSNNICQSIFLRKKKTTKHILLWACRSFVNLLLYAAGRKQSSIKRVFALQANHSPVSKRSLLLSVWTCVDLMVHQLRVGSSNGWVFLFSSAKACPAFPLASHPPLLLVCETIFFSFFISPKSLFVE